MRNVSRFYKDFLEYKLNELSTFINLFKKIKNIEDFRFAIGLGKIAIRMLLKKVVNNETVRGR